MFTSHKFVDLYKESGGPDLDTIFDSKAKYSPWVLTFVLCHRELINVSRLELDSGVLVFVGEYRMYSEENSPYPTEEVQWKKPEIKLAKDLEEAIALKLPFPSQSLTFKAAVNFLKYGYGPNVEFEDIHRHHTNGECLIVTFPSKGDKYSPPEVLRIHSYAYQKRYMLVDNQPNFALRFFTLATDAMQPFDSPDALYHYISKYPVVEDIEDVNKAPGMLSKSKRRLFDFKGRLRNVWLNYMLALPQYRRMEVMPLFDFYFYVNKEVRNWLFNNYYNQPNERIHSRPTRDAMHNLQEIAKKRQNNKLYYTDVKNMIYWSTGWEIYSIYMSTLKSVDSDGEISVNKTPLQEKNGYIIRKKEVELEKKELEVEKKEVEVEKNK